MTLKDHIQSWRLYAITDIGLAGNKNYPEILESVLSAGARVVQLRDKSTPFEELMEIGPRLVQTTHERDAVLIVNDNPYLAREIDADGVHLGQTDMPPDIAREIVGPEKIIGLSTHTRPQAIKALAMDVDYIGIGPVFPTETKKSEYYPVGLSMVRWTAQKISLPFVCIGGITLENLPDVLAAGARSCAVVSGIMAAPDIGKSAREYQKVFEMFAQEEESHG